MNNGSPLLTWDEAIAYCRLDTADCKSPRDTLRRYVNKKRLRTTRVGKFSFFLRSELDAFLEQQTGRGN